MADTNQNEIISSFNLDVTKRASGENVCGSLGDETCGQTDSRNLFRLIYAAGYQPEMLIEFCQRESFKTTGGCLSLRVRLMHSVKLAHRIHVCRIHWF